MLQQVAALSAKEGRDGGPSSKQGLRAKGSNDDGASRRYQPLEPTRSNSTSAWSSEGIIVPDGTWKENWDIWILVLILYSAAIVPYRVCFDVEAEGLLWVFEAAMSIFFLIDVVLSFRTAYFVDGVWVTDPQMIANRYLKGWFWIDAPSSLPLEILALFETLGDNSQLSLLRFLRLMRLLRLLKLLKIDQYLDMMEEVLEMNLRFVQLIIMLAKVGFLSHILGCFWYGVGANSRGPDGDGATWYTSYGGDEEATVGQLYMWSIYWAVMTLTTTGYGDVVPTNDNERLYVLMALIVGALVFGYMISNLSAVINSLDRQAVESEEKLDGVKQYAMWRQLPRHLAVRLKRHYKYQYERDGVQLFNEMDLLNGCPPALRSDLIASVLAETLGKVRALREGRRTRRACARRVHVAAPHVLVAHVAAPHGCWACARGMRAGARLPRGRRHFRLRVPGGALPAPQARLLLRRRRHLQKGRALEGAPLPHQGACARAAHALPTRTRGHVHGLVHVARTCPWTCTACGHVRTCAWACPRRATPPSPCTVASHPSSARTPLPPRARSTCSRTMATLSSAGSRPRRRRSSTTIRCPTRCLPLRSRTRAASVSRCSPAGGGPPPTARTRSSRRSSSRRMASRRSSRCAPAPITLIS